MTTESRKKFLIDIAFFAVIGVMIYLAFKMLSAYLLPFVIGIAASFLVQKPVKVISSKTKISKGFATVFLVVLTYFALLALMILIGYLLYNIVSAVAGFFPKYTPIITEALGKISTSLSLFMNDLPDSVSGFLNELPNKLISSLSSYATKLLSTTAAAVAKSVPGIIISIIVTVVASCYTAKDYDKIIKFAHNQLPKKTWDILITIKELLVTNVFKILKGYFFLMMLTFAELFVALTIIGKKNALMLAAIISIVDILPVLGTGTVLIPWALFCLVTGKIVMAICLIVIYVVITIIRNFLEPKVIGVQIGLHPLIMLVSIFCGYKLMGFLGIFILPMTLIIIIELNKQGKINIFKKKEDEALNN